MRQLVQPGPVHPQRIDTMRGHARELRFTLQAGLTLAEAVTTPLLQAGFQAAAVSIEGAVLAPFYFVMPGPPDGAPDGAAHVAYFTAAVCPPGQTRVLRAACTFGFSNGSASIHCHAAWIEADGRRRGGHILPAETRLAEPAQAVAWGFADARIETAPDAETNFTLFQIAPALPMGRDGPPAGVPAILARVRPNEDILTAIERIGLAHGLSDAVIRGSVGSLVGARFTDGSAVDDYATEVLVTRGGLHDGKASLDLLVVDMQGNVHQGSLVRGENPVLITFDLMLTA